MSSEGPGLMGLYWRLALGSALLGVLWAYEGSRFDFAYSETLRPAWLLASLCLLTLTGLIGAVNVYLLGAFDRIGFRSFCGVFWRAWAVHLVSPGQVGDMAAISVMMRRHGLAWSVSLGRLLVDKLISLAVIGGFALAGYVLFLSTDVSLWSPRSVAWACAVALGCLAAIIVVASRKPAWFVHIREASSETFAALKERPRRLLLNVALTIAKTILTGSALWAVFAGLGNPLPYWPAVCLVMSAAIVAYVPISVNGIGTVEAVAIQLFEGVGSPAGETLQVFLLYRLLVMAVAWIPSIFMLFWGAGRSNVQR